jgi:hypothetical protein
MDKPPGTEGTRTDWQRFTSLTGLDGPLLIRSREALSLTMILARL